jgi:DNA helicase HerA-like ATPase
MYEIVIGRDQKDKEKYGTKGAIFLGKQYVTMGQTTSVSNAVYLDMIRSHIILVAGKRGSGKSYTLGVVAEGMADLPPEIKQNLTILLLDTMGVYWTMKYPNKKELPELKEWGLDPKGLDVQIYTPTLFFEEYRNKGIPTDFPFALQPNELTPEDWCITFDVNINEPIGVLIERAINTLREQTKEEGYSIQEIIDAIDSLSAEADIKNAAKNRFYNTLAWGIFDKKGTKIEDLAQAGKVGILDVSCYATMPNGWKIKCLVVGLVCKKLFMQRMLVRKDEEFAQLHESMRYFSTEQDTKQEFPLVWVVVDEAHEFLPRQGKTTATDPLITILREGRQPGISLILATQQPGKIHTDVMTQSDTVLSHRITAKIDTEALGTLMQSYMREGLDVQLDKLPRTKGSALLFDDTNEKLYPVKIRPRFTWHGGESPTALHEVKDRFKM